MAGERITRRGFLEQIAAGGLTAVAYFICAGLLEGEGKEFELDWLAYPERYKFRLRQPALPANNQGIFINTPFLYLAEDEAVDRLLPSLGPWTKGVRVFINDKYEPRLGEYDKRVLDRLVVYGEKLAAMGKTLQVDFFDGFTMHRTWNPIYGGSGATSPYAAYGNEAFFGEEKVVNTFIDRVRSILPTVLAIPNLSALSIANELRPTGGKQGRLEFAAWYQRIVDEIRQWSVDMPIYSGVARPSLLSQIAGLTANTAHLYPFLNVERELLKNEQDVPEPIVVQEVGATNTYFGFDFPVSRDEILSEYLRSILQRTTMIDYASRTVTLAMATLYPWKLDNYVDGFHVDGTFERTNEVLATLAGIYERLG